MVQHIIVALIAILLCLIPDNANNRRSKYLMPLAFAIVTVFWAIRYNYGLDYVEYQNMFERGDTSTAWRDNKETFFYLFLNSFQYFYQFVIAFTLLTMGCLFIWVRKFCNEKYYAIFFIMFMFMNAMSYSMMSAMRSTMAAVVLWAALYFFYIKKKNWILYSLLVFVASGFHLSVISFLVLPIVDIIIPRVKGIYLFYCLIGCFIFSLFGNESLFNFITSSNAMLDGYNSYYSFVESNNISIFGVMNNALFLFPAYYICRSKDQLIQSHKGIFVLAVLYLVLYSLNLDIQNRFTSYIGIFFIIAISVVAGGQKYIDAYGFEHEIQFTSKQDKWIMLAPLLIKILFDYYKFYLLMSSPYYMGLDGNPLIYQTIFDAPQLP